MYHNVSIIILNWNNWKDTIECLESLYQIDYSSYNVIIVDNNSSDDSVEKIKEYCGGKLEVKSDFFEYNPNNKPINILELTKAQSKNVKIVNGFSNLPSNRKLILIKNDVNYGFAEGNNIGILFALNNLNFKYILLLNNDTVVDKEFLNELVKVTEKDKEIGICGSTIYWYDDKNKIQSAGAKLSLNTGNQHLILRDKTSNELNKEISNVDYVSGCSLFARKELFVKVGLLNKEYFLYWEETDLCFRVHKTGYKIVHVPYSKVWHKESSSTKEIGNIPSYYISRNMFLFMKQNTTKKQYLTFLLYFFGFKLGYTIISQILYYKNIDGLICFFKGVHDGTTHSNKFQHRH